MEETSQDTNPLWPDHHGIHTNYPAYRAHTYNHRNIATVSMDVFYRKYYGIDGYQYSDMVCAYAT